MPPRSVRRTGSMSRSVEETRRPEMGKLSPLPPPYDLVSHRRAQERRHRHTAMGDGDIVAGSPRHRSDGRQMVAGDRADGYAHRLRLDLADRGKQLSGAPHQVARLRHRRAKTRVEAQCRVGRVPMQQQAPRAIRTRVNYGGANYTAQAGSDRGREHQEPHGWCERQVQTSIPGCLVGPATGTVHDSVGLVLRAVGDADPGHTIAGHDQVYDPGVADDFRAMAKPRGGQHGVRVDHRIEPTLFRKERHRRIADCRRIDVGLQFLPLAEREPLRGIAPGSQLLDVFTLRRAIGFGFPFQAAAAVPPWRGTKLVGQRGMRLHAGDIQIVIGLRRLFVRVGPREANAGGAAADAHRFQYRYSRAGLSQPIRDRGAHDAGADHYRLNHLRLLWFKMDYGTRPGPPEIRTA